MRNTLVFGKSEGQTAIEYLILLGVVAAIALMGFKTMMPHVRKESDTFFNVTANRIMGPALTGGAGYATDTVGRDRQYP